MEGFVDFLDGNLAEQPCAEGEDSRHWLDAHYPRGARVQEEVQEEEEYGGELLEKPGLNGCGMQATDGSTGERAGSEEERGCRP